VICSRGEVKLRAASHRVLLATTTTVFSTLGITLHAILGFKGLMMKCPSSRNLYKMHTSLLVLKKNASAYQMANTEKQNTL